MTEALRRDAVICALAGVAAVDPADLVRAALQKLHIRDDVTLFAVGKAAVPMASAAASALASTIRRGIVIAPVAARPPAARIDCYTGGHPAPNDQGADGARALVALFSSMRAGETLLCLISGGASSLMTLPAQGLTVEDVSTTATLLMRAGATIEQLNCVRKHIDRLKGGRLAALAFPSAVVALVLSDVVGDDMATIASGPTVADPTTIADAISVLHERGVWDAIPMSVRDHLTQGDDESPKPGDPRLARSTSHIIGSNVNAAAAACLKARSLGYSARIVTTSLTGEAAEEGQRIARDVRDECERERRRVALVYAGETTVTVRGSGSGGRNQELVLGAAVSIDGVSGVAIASLGTDGIDGPTDAAGAVADGESIARARSLGIDPAKCLASNDSHTFWKALGGLVRTGPTGTNVMDIVVALATPTA
ncbi:MAG: DUF4147 domain-containing protein [Gemmatimonadota bacterium]|nr:DUF4147 domain-containing protein [Gemmatimonadota bacterium]